MPQELFGAFFSGSLSESHEYRGVERFFSGHFRGKTD